jgi:hypothetical protein
MAMKKIAISTLAIGAALVLLLVDSVGLMLLVASVGSARSSPPLVDHTEDSQQSVTLCATWRRSAIAGNERQISRAIAPR